MLRNVFSLCKATNIDIEYKIILLLSLFRKEECIIYLY